MNRNPLRGMTIMAGLLVMAVIVQGAFKPSWAGPYVVKAKKSAAGPAVDGEIENEWNRIRPVKIHISEGRIGSLDVSVKALYTGTDLYLLLQWEDGTESLNRLYVFERGQWKKEKGDEDRLAIVWNINDSIKGFEKKGCNIICHKNEYMGTESDTEIGDIWHWKSQRTNPLGYADDQYVTNKENPEGEYRYYDSEVGGHIENWDKEARQPLYTSPADKEHGPILLKTEAVGLDPSANYPEGTKIPGDVLAPPISSGADIEAKGVWREGKWTLEIRRALETGNEEDVRFDDLSKMYFFGISVFDDTDGERHSYSDDVCVLQFLQ